MIKLGVKSSSGGTYDVSFTFNDGRLIVGCTCKAAIVGHLCKHRLALLAGDAKILAHPEQASDLARVTQWAAEAGFPEICNKILTVERNIAEAQIQLKRLKTALLKRIT